jgi:hypothetical protein
MADFCPHCNPCRHGPAHAEVERLTRAMKLIEHATAPGSDGGGHENAYSIALLALGDKAHAARAGSSHE